MKKLIALLLALVMVFSLAACGGGSDNSGGNTNPPGGNDNPGGGDGGNAGLDVGKVEDLHVTWPSLGGAPADMAMIEAAVNEIVTPKLGVNVILEAIPLSDLTSQQQLMISSGGSLDLISMLWTGLDTWVNTESVLELEDYLPTYGAGIVDLFGDAAYGATYDGHVYAIPTEQSGFNYGFFARSDILEKYGYDTADRSITVEELEEIFATVKAGEGNAFFPVAGGGSFQCVGAQYDLLGGNFYTGAVMINGDTDTVVNIFETDEYAEYAQRMYDWAQKGYISADAAASEEQPQTLISTGSCLGAFVYLGQSTKNSYGSNGAVPLTALEIIPGYTTTSDLLGVMWGVASTCKIPEKAVAFLNELYTNTDLSRILTFGIEGTHYEVVEESADGKKLVAMPEGVDMMSSGYYVFLGVWAPAPDTVWDAGVGYAEIEDKEIRKDYDYSPAFGYVFNSTEFSTELTALSAVYSEYSKIIDCGAIDPATELTAFINALKAANIDEVIAANQEQYNAWKAAQ